MDNMDTAIAPRTNLIPVPAGEAAQILGVTKRSLFRRMKSGELSWDTAVLNGRRQRRVYLDSSILAGALRLWRDRTPLTGQTSLDTRALQVSNDVALRMVETQAELTRAVRDVAAQIAALRLVFTPHPDPWPRRLLHWAAVAVAVTLGVVALAALVGLVTRVLD